MNKEMIAQAIKDNSQDVSSGEFGHIELTPLQLDQAAAEIMELGDERIKELEAEVERLKGQAAKYELLVKAQDSLINLHNSRSESSSSNWCESCGGRNCIC
jgi:Rad3-related DNA helicase